jgi:hypothetical protein
MKLHSLFGALFAISGSVALATDVTFNYSFTASFLSGPITSVTGAFGGTFTPVGFGTNISSLDYVNLQVNGFTYSTGNVSLQVANGQALLGGDYSGVFTLYGSLNGTSAFDGTHDFFLVPP